MLSHRSSVVAVVNLEERFPWDGAALMLPRRDGLSGEVSCSAEPFQGGARAGPAAAPPGEPPCPPPAWGARPERLPFCSARPPQGSRSGASGSTRLPVRAPVPPCREASVVRDSAPLCETALRAS